MSVLEEVRGVRLIVTPQDMMKESVPDAPAVMIDNEIIAENGKKGNGMVSENEILSILKRHGAIIIADDE